MLRVKKAGLIGLTMLLLTVFICLNPTPARAAESLTDISDHWAYAEINNLFGKGIISGDPGGTFRPDDRITRAEFIALVNRAFGYSATTTIAFTDVKTGDWYYWDLAKAVQAGYITGYNDGTVRPFAVVTRQEAAVIGARILGLDTSGASVVNFTDALVIPGWSRGSIDAMVKSGYMQAFGDGAFRPLNSISRAEAAVLIYDCMTPRVPVTAVNLDKSSVTLFTGEKISLKASLTPGEASDKRVTWSSSDNKVAIVNNNGQVTAIGDGNCTITVTTIDGGFEDTCRINVKQSVKLKGISLDKSSVTLGVGFSVILYGSFTPENATNQNVAWSSSNKSVAVVSDTGRVTGIRPGTATITVKSQEGGFYDTCKVTVTDEGYVLINPSSFTMYLHRGTTRTLYANVRGDDSAVLGVTWESDDEDVAAVDYEPLSLEATLTALDTGKCNITIEVVTEEGDYTDSSSVRVLD